MKPKVERESAAPPKPRPILFSGEMVRAILEGRKTQTRRVCKGVALEMLNDGFAPSYVADPGNTAWCPYGQPGDHLWVRETISQHHHIGFPLEGVKQVDEARRRVWSYTADRTDEGTVTRKRPAIHMPRWASRITLGILKIRIERIQQITNADAIAEGIAVKDGDLMSPKEYYSVLWDKLNAERGFGWDANPWVWVIEFKRLLEVGNAG